MKTLLIPRISNLQGTKEFSPNSQILVLKKRFDKRMFELSEVQVNEYNFYKELLCNIQGATENSSR